MAVYPPTAGAVWGYIVLGMKLKQVQAANNQLQTQPGSHPGRASVLPLPAAPSLSPPLSPPKEVQKDNNTVGLWQGPGTPWLPQARPEQPQLYIQPWCRGVGHVERDG